MKLYPSHSFTLNYSFISHRMSKLMLRPFLPFFSTRFLSCTTNGKGLLMRRPSDKGFRFYESPLVSFYSKGSIQGTITTAKGCLTLEGFSIGFDKFPTVGTKTPLLPWSRKGYIYTSREVLLS